MSTKWINSSRIKSLTLHKYKNEVYFHYNFPPIIILLILNTVIYFFWHEHLQGYFVASAVIALLYVFTILLAYWKIGFRTFIMYNRIEKLPSEKEFSQSSVKVEEKPTKLRKNRLQKQITTANTLVSKYYAHILPEKLRGLEALVPLQYQKGHLFFEYQKRKYIFDREEKKLFLKPKATHKDTVDEYLRRSDGLNDENVLKSSKFAYGDNLFDIPLPTFLDVYKEHALKPFFVFQVFCVCLWLLDEMWYYSFFTLFMLFVFEATIVTQRINNLKFVRGMRKKPYAVRVKRDGTWKDLYTDQLVPYDIVSIRAGEFAPCDILLLEGKVVADEALLTGESTPQVKNSIKNFDISIGSSDKYEKRVDLKSNEFKGYVVFGGTKVLQTNISKSENINEETGLVKQGLEKKCHGIVLRTGFETNQGQLLRTILFSTEHMSANNLEALFFIFFLLMFAICASSYVFYVGIQDPDKSKWKLFLNCIMIITSVVPPELPMELSLAVNSSLMALQKFEIFCTEPFRIPLAGKIDVCCFDKTGTLTTEKMALTQIVLPNGKLLDPVKIQHPTQKKMKTLGGIPIKIRRLLSSCHSLIFHNDEVVGDPMEVAGLLGSGYDYKDDVALIETSEFKNLQESRSIKIKKKVEYEGDSKSKKKKDFDEIRIVKRFPFSSVLKRMSVIIQLKSKKSSDFYVYLKGAAEVVENMLADVPKNYSEISRKIAAGGKRVIALARKKIRETDFKKARREFTEKDLEFLGFAVFDTDLKPETRETILALLQSDHHVVMITGDHPLTAIHVAKELTIVSEHKRILTFDGGSTWIDVRTEEKVDSDEINLDNDDLAITGDKLKTQDEKWCDLWIPKIKVYARTTPIQKELVITTFKDHDYGVLMCGDGTNDVGGLKQSDIGIALLASPMDRAQIKKTKSDEEEKVERERIVESTKKKTFRELLADPAVNAKYVKMGWWEKMKFQMEVSRGGAGQAKIGGESITDILAEGSDQPLVQLGDASIAAPFTSRKSSISSVIRVITQGRCTLVTTMQMYKILALHCLLMAYSLSVLYMMGVKFGDKQMLIQGVGIAVCFLFISRAPPIDHLDSQRPVTSIFAASMVCSMLGQFIIHITNLVLVIHASRIVVPLTSSQKDLEGDYEKNLLNSVVFVMETLQAIVTFLVNYEGWPFMLSMWQNKKLLFVILGIIGLVFVVAMNLIPEVNDALEVVDFPDDFRNFLVKMMMADVIMVVLYERLVYHCFMKFSKFSKR